MHTEAAIEESAPEEQKHLRDYFRILLNRKGTVLTIFIITSLAVVLMSFSNASVPLYTASTQVLIERNLTGGNIEGLRTYMVWDPSFRPTQFELIRSFNVAHRVVDNLQLDTTYRKYFFKKQQESFLPATYFLTKIKAFIAKILQKNIKVETEINKNSKKADVDPQKDADIIAGIIINGLKVAPQQDTKIVNISFSFEDQAIAQLIVNAIVQAYIAETLEIKASATTYTLKWMTAKAKLEQKKIESSEKKLQQYQRDHNIITVENKLAIYPQKLSELNSQLLAAQAKVREYGAIYKQIEKAGNDYRIIETLPLLTSNSLMQDLRVQLFAAEQNIKELSKKFGRKHPQIIQARAERNQLLQEKKLVVQRIITTTQNAYELAQTSVKELTALNETTKAELLKMNERMMQYKLMHREMELNRMVYDSLITTIKKASVTEQAQELRIWVVKKAGLPSIPSTPSKQKKILIGMMAGLIAGVLLAFFLEYLDNTVKSVQKIEDRYKLPVLGSVEDLADKNSAIENYIQEHPLSPIAENYRLIRSSLLLSTPDHPPRTILITSMMQQEGKTTTTCNLAHILAQNNKKVLIIDCDLRRPRQHSMFGLANTYGLSNFLSGNIDKKQKMVQKVPDTNIFLITSGPLPPNPAELLGSKRMRSIVTEFQDKFDFVLLDSPPLQQVTDSLVLGTLADGTLIVIKSGKTTYDMLDSGIRKLREGHTNILGVILNRLKKRHSAKGYYGYYSYYSKGNYYSYGNDKS